jgi:hypothetical protein
MDNIKENEMIEKNMKNFLNYPPLPKKEWIEGEDWESDLLDQYSK